MNSVSSFVEVLQQRSKIGPFMQSVIVAVDFQAYRLASLESDSGRPDRDVQLNNRTRGDFLLLVVRKPQLGGDLLLALLFGQHWVLAESTFRSAETTGGTIVLVEVEVVYLVVGGTVRLHGERNVQIQECVAVEVQLADDDVDVHVVFVVGGHKQFDLGWPEDLCVFVEGVSEVRSFFFPSVGVVRYSGDLARLLIGETALSGLQVQRMILGSCGRVVVLRTVGNSRSISEAQKRSADFGRILPSIVFAQQVVVQEPLKVVVALRLVDVVPLLNGVDAKPGRRVRDELATKLHR